MYLDIIKEYTDLLNRKAETEGLAFTLAKGYIYKQKNGSSEYCYLKYRNGSTVESKYLKTEEIPEIEKQLELRKTNEALLPQIENRLSEIEKAAELLNAALSRKLSMLKLSVDMDNITHTQKEKCISFSDALTSIEGVPVSRDVENGLNDWQLGKISFATMFEQTLSKYGFVKEV